MFINEINVCIFKLFMSSSGRAPARCGAARWHVTTVQAAALPASPLPARAPRRRKGATAFLHDILMTLRSNEICEARVRDEHPLTAGPSNLDNRLDATVPPFLLERSYAGKNMHKNCTIGEIPDNSQWRLGAPLAFFEAKREPRSS